MSIVPICPPIPSIESASYGPCSNDDDSATVGALDAGIAQSPSLWVSIDGQEFPVEPEDLFEPEYLADLVERCSQATAPAVFTAEHLFLWHSPSQSSFLRLLHSLGDQARLRLTDGGEACADPFKAIVDNLVGPADFARCSGGRTAAVQAAAIFYPESVDLACGRVAAKFKELGVTGVLPQTLQKEARSLIGINPESSGPNPTEAAQAFYASICRAIAGSESHYRTVAYFADDFYLWNETRWKRAADNAILAHVTSFLQQQPAAKVTARWTNAVSPQTARAIGPPDFCRPRIRGR